MPLTLPPTTNRSSQGTSVYCFSCQQSATVLRTNGLGLDYAPVLLCDDGVTRMFCGTSLRDYCQHIDLFVQTLQELGFGSTTIQGFKDAWYANADRETERQGYYDGLVTARATADDTTKLNYITTVAASIGATL